MNRRFSESLIDSGIDEFDSSPLRNISTIEDVSRTSLAITQLPSQRRFGREVIDDIDLSRVNENGIREIRKSLATHGLLLFRRQSLNNGEMCKFAASIGDGRLEPSARKISHEKTEKFVVNLTNLRDRDGAELGFPGNDTDFWHSDQEFREHPASIGMLYCLIATDIAGGTSYASTAVENCGLEPEDLHLMRTLWSTRRPADSHDNVPRVTVAHPVVLKNPYTDREFIYVSENTIDFVGDEIGATKGLKGRLLTHILAAENVYTHSWRIGDVIIYDNTQLLHRRESFEGIRFIKGMKIFPDGRYLSAPAGYVVRS